MAAQAETSAVGVYDDLAKAENTLDELRRAGFKADEIGIIGHVGNEPQTFPPPNAVRAPEGNVTRGVATGGIWGAVVGLVVIAAIPGLGWISGMGRVFEVVGGAVLGAAVGGILFAASALFFSRARGRVLEKELDKGRFIVTVTNPSRQQEAKALLGRQGVRAEGR